MDYRSLAQTAARLLKEAGQQYTLTDAEQKKLGTLMGINNDKEIRLDGAVVGIQTGVMLAATGMAPLPGMLIIDPQGNAALIQVVNREAPAGTVLYYEVVTKV